MNQKPSEEIIKIAKFLARSKHDFDEVGDLNTNKYVIQAILVYLDEKDSHETV